MVPLHCSGAGRVIEARAENMGFPKASIRSSGRAVKGSASVHSVHSVHSSGKHHPSTPSTVSTLAHQQGYRHRRHCGRWRSPAASVTSVTSVASLRRMGQPGTPRPGPLVRCRGHSAPRGGEASARNPPGLGRTPRACLGGEPQSGLAAACRLEVRASDADGVGVLEPPACPALCRCVERHVQAMSLFIVFLADLRYAAF